VNRWNNARGMTLIEMMIALVIIGILAAIIIPDYISRADRAREANVKGNMHTLQLAVEDYAVEHEGYYSDVIDATHIANRLPTSFANPFSLAAGGGLAWEDRASMSAAPSPIKGITSYADSDTVVYNIKGTGRSAPLSIVLTTGR
jgi:prepilin-type N-terminal cleavage/methylation domain-containing protein